MGCGQTTEHTQMMLPVHRQRPKILAANLGDNAITVLDHRLPISPPNADEHIDAKDPLVSPSQTFLQSFHILQSNLGGGIRGSALPLVDKERSTQLRQFAATVG